MNLDIFETQIFFTTVRITVQKNTGDGSSVGTGFLVQAPVPGYPNRNALLLISNKHVFHDPQQPVELRFHARSKQNPKEPDLSGYVTYTNSNLIGLYAEHPDPKIDVACSNVSFISDPKHGIYWKHLPLDMFSAFDEPHLVPGRSAWFVGYPENRFDTAHNLPILRVGHIASIPTVDFNGEPQFLIDAQVFPGSSGSPVLTDIQNKYCFLGVLSRVMIKNQKIESIPAVTAPGVTQVLGLGIVFKASKVRELIDTVVTGIANRLKQSEQEPTTEAAEAAPQAIN